MLIERLSDIERVNALENIFEKSSGIKPFNISNWHVSQNFTRKFLECFEAPTVGNPVDYIYTYSLPNLIRENVLGKLGVTTPDSMLLVLPNNTIAIVNAANLIRQHGFNNVCIVNPAYFSVAQTFHAMNIHYETVCMIRKDGDYIFPIDDIIQGNYDAVWITSPVYSTGVYLKPTEIEKIRFLLKKEIYVVVDESFALQGYELVRQLGVPKNFMSICSPHKSIVCNGIKFSGIITSDIYEDFLEQWVDVLGGNLPQSSYAAVYHYLSENYDNCLKLFNSEMEIAKRTIAPILMGKHCSTDTDIVGSLLTVYFDNIQFEVTKRDVFFNSLYKNTYASLYPGWLNGFGREFGLCFRINLALNGMDFQQALCRIIDYLDAL